jgi:serine/threonine protein phosphatase PrpC
MFTYEYAQQSERGGREYNEDCCDMLANKNKQRYCYVIADGLGGHQGGKIASKLLVNYIINNFLRITNKNLKTELTAILQEANNLILDEGKKSYQMQDMKTTCVVLIILNGFAYWAHVGDSRLYIVRQNKIIHQTEDHSVVQALVKMGDITPEEIPNHPQRSQLLKVLGTKYELTPTIVSEGLKLHREDCLLLCTDGFWEYIPDDLISKLTNRIKLASETILDDYFQKVIEIGKVKTAKYDNLTTQLVMVK